MGSFIRSLPLVMFFLMVAFALAMAAVAVFAGLHARRRAALVQSTPAAYVATASPGYAQFEGRVEAIDRQTLVAPLTRAACVWYHARVEKRADLGGDERGQSAWATVRDVTSEAPFFFRDGGGVAVVQPYGAEVTPTDKSRWYGDAETPENVDPPRLKPTEASAGMVDIAGTHRFRYFEERIYDGDPLFVMGSFGRRSASADAEDDDPDDLLDGEDGDAIEPDADETLAEQLTDRGRRATAAFITRGDGKQPFIVTTTPKAAHAELTALGSQAAMGVALVPLGLAVLLLWARFG